MFGMKEFFSKIVFCIVQHRGGEAICYHGPHELCIIAGGLQNQSINFILKLYLYLTMRKSDFSRLAIQVPTDYELCFELCCALT